MPIEETPRQKKQASYPASWDSIAEKSRKLSCTISRSLALLPGRAAPDREHAFYAGIEQAFAQHALPDHAGGAEQDDFHPLIHPLMNASRSALIVAASVVGMPCGKPL